jgi:hypothetical protein
MTRRATPRTDVEALRAIDDILATLAQRYPAARSRLLDMQPGHSGRPAGTGEPGGGSSGTSSVTERVALGRHDERHQLEQLEHLPATVQRFAAELAGMAGLNLPTAPPQSLPSARLAWARWAVRLVLLNGRKPAHNATQRLWHAVVALDDLVERWASDIRRYHHDVKGLGITTTSTLDWCPNHLRAQLHEPSHRSTRYCRWCFDFRAAQGYLPEPTLLEARHLGRKITEQLISQCKPNKRKKVA